ncbi:MAG: hypothetical protein ACRCXX_14465 [Cetobacterium sp.]|uniref:hypothetical protein n=1 Tax=Cetobacterium sp. TaxID=2071632 RepID=UPI003F2F9A82
MVLIIIVGPSLSGKDMIANEFFASKIATKLISTTTRESRGGEVDGVDYYFISESEFEDAVVNQKFFEHVTYGVNKDGKKATRYGFYKTELDKLKSGNVLAIVTPEGAERLKKYAENAKIFYIKTDPAKRKEMALKRYGENAQEYEAQIDARMKIDEEIFFEYELEPGVITLNNNYDRDSFTRNLRTIMENIYDLSANDTIDKSLIEQEIKEEKIRK